MPFGIDIQDEEMRSWGHRIFETPPRSENIIWTTNDYVDRSASYTFYDQITPEKICHKTSRVIVSRVQILT